MRRLRTDHHDHDHDHDHHHHGQRRRPPDLPDAAARGSAGLHASAVNFSKCMRAHGVPKFPDPSSDGRLTIRCTGINTNSLAFKSAQRACQSLQSSPGGQGHLVRRAT
jgi:hypothetical protein